MCEPTTRGDFGASSAAAVGGYTLGLIRLLVTSVLLGAAPVRPGFSSFLVPRHRLVLGHRTFPRKPLRPRGRGNKKARCLSRTGLRCGRQKVLHACLRHRVPAKPDSLALARNATTRQRRRVHADGPAPAHRCGQGWGCHVMVVIHKTGPRLTAVRQW